MPRHFPQITSALPPRSVTRGVLARARLTVAAVSCALVILSAFASAAPGHRFLAKWGTLGSGNGQFTNGPAEVARDAAGNVYAADNGNDRIQKFSSSGAFITKWGSHGSGDNPPDGTFFGPRGLATDAARNVYVADFFNARIEKFSATGAFITKWGSSGSGDNKFGAPTGVATDKAGHVYVADAIFGRVKKFSSTGAFIRSMGTPGGGDGRLEIPEGVAVDAAGNVYVADAMDDVIQKFSSTGAFLAKWGTPGTHDGQFDRPHGVAIDAAGHVYVADYGGDRIQKFSSTGTFLGKVGTPGSGNGQLVHPVGVATDAAGDLYVGDFGNNRIEKFNALPAVQTIAIKPKTFVAAPTGRPRKGAGALVRYTLDETASVRFTVQRAAAGRADRSGRCVPETPRNRRAKRCTRFVQLPGSLKLNGKVGANNFRFTGHLAGRQLAPGSYRLAAEATPGDGTSASAPFQIAQP